MEIKDAVWDVFWDYINDVWEKYSDMDYVPLRRHLDEENFKSWFYAL